MKWKKLLFLCSITLLLSSICMHAFAEWDVDERWEIDSRWEIDLVAAPVPRVSYINHLATSDGNIIMYGGINLKPNTIHTYIPQFNGRYKNITLDSGTLGLSKGEHAYNIACSTDDNVTIDLNQWFYSDTTQFRPNAENETTLSFTVNSRNKGEPQGVNGASTWDYNAATTTVSLTASNNSLVTIRWESMGTRQLLWYMDRMTMFMGIGGLLMILLSPAMFVFFGKKDEWQNACIWGLMLGVIGMGLIIGWLWG